MEKRKGGKRKTKRIKGVKQSFTPLVSRGTRVALSPSESNNLLGIAVAKAKILPLNLACMHACMLRDPHFYPIKDYKTCFYIIV